VTNRYNRVTSSKGLVESWEYQMSPLEMVLNSGDEFGLTWRPQYEFLAEPFEIASGVVIPPGAYRFDRWEIEAETSNHRVLRLNSSTSFGEFYSGHLAQWENSVSWTSPRGALQLSAGAEHNYARLPEGNFVQRLWQLQSAYAWSPNIVLTSFVQFDTESQNLGSNTRLRWTFKPGNDLFVVWNRGWQRLLRDPHERVLAPESELLAVKLRWTFRQ
jgi:hypothetical protein